jgi:hypothetical protein
MLTEERVDAIFKEMDGYVLELVPDPTSLGPQYFRDHIAVCRNFLNRVGLVLNELNRERLLVSGELRRLEALYALDYDNLLTNEPEIKSLDSIEDRKSAVGYRLREQRTAINELKARMHSLDSVYKVVSYRNRELHATMTAIKDQSKLMSAEIRSGGFYGDERTDTAGRDPMRSRSMVTDDVSAEELAQMMADPTPEGEATGVESETAPVQQDVSSEATAVPEEGDEAAALRFLSGSDTLVDVVTAPPSKPAPEEDDFMSLLEGL